MPPRGKKKASASAKKPKGPSPRSKRAVAETAATEDDIVPGFEVPSNAVEESKTPEPELLSDEENKTSEPEVPSSTVEEEKVPEPEAVSNDTVEEVKQVTDVEVPTSTVVETEGPEAKVLSSVEEALWNSVVEEAETETGITLLEEMETTVLAETETTVLEETETTVLEETETYLLEETKAGESNVISEELLYPIDHNLEAVEPEREDEISKDVEEIMDGVNEGDDTEMDQDQGIHEQGDDIQMDQDQGIYEQGDGVNEIGDIQMDQEQGIHELGVNESDDIQMDQEQGIHEKGIEQDRVEEETVVEDKNIEGAGVDDAGAHEGDDKVQDVDKSGSDEEDNDDEDEEDHAIYMHAPMSDKKKQKDFEIFIGGLDREAVEEDLIKVFGQYGEIQSARIVKHPTTQKSKGFAFIRYATVEQAKKVLAELKDGIEVRGKRVGISASQDNDTIYLGNICKTWTKDNVIAALNGYGIEQIDEVFLPEDPKNEGKIKGYAFVEFSTHSDAMAAFQRLRKPDAVFGSDRSAKVAFAPSSMHPSEEILSQVKTVYVECLPESWDEEKVMEHCKQYGEIEKVQLSRNFTNARRRDFGFIAFVSRESAVACVEGINNAQLVEGEMKVKANIAKPQNKGRLAKQGARGGFRVKKDGEYAEAGGYSMKSNASFKRDVGKGKVHSNSKGGRGGKTFRPYGQVTGGQGGAPFQYHQKKEQAFRGGKRNAGFMDNKRPSKKAYDNRNFSSNFSNMRGRPSGNRNNSRFGKSKKNYNKHPAAYRNPYPPARGGATSSYQGGAYGAVSGSKRPYSDMEPHAGFVEAGGKQARGPYGYGQGSNAGGYEIQGTSAPAGYPGGSVPQSSQVPDYSSYAGYEGQAGYAYPPNNAAAYPPNNAVAYPPNNAAYQPNNAAYPPNNAAYPPNNAAAYPPHGAYY